MAFTEVSSFITIDKVILQMKNLRHLYAPTMMCSEDVPLDKMKKLQTLTLFYLITYSSVWQIQGLVGVTTLGFKMSEMTDASELFTHLASLRNLVSLTLIKCSDIVNMDGLGALHRITELKLDDMRILPTNFPPKLSYLTLSGMSLSKDPMPVLERLPELLYLKLDFTNLGGFFRQNLVITDQGFPKLKALHLKVKCVTNIQVEKGGMSELQQLFIHDSPGLDVEYLPEHLKSAIIDG